MIRIHRHIARGFSLVELLAVVLILSVLAATAVPLYLNTRKVAAARACKGNIAAIMTTESASALRNGTYLPYSSLNAAGTETLAALPVCPVDGTSAYQISTVSSGGTELTTTTSSLIYIQCPNFAAHAAAQGVGNGAWKQTMPTIITDSLP